ncbi:MAG: 4Fe-4S dicluster domain-containing protein [Magnetococcales bacterium]|nr:4Fe-4S dicluster domain-containing protein [Magnetococcales bacterium]
MRPFLLRRDELPNWIKHLARESQVYFPQRAGRSGFRFKQVREGSLIQLEHYRPTIVPPGKKLFPAEEILFRYQTMGDEIPVVTPVLDASKQILAGVRPCDLKGIDLMDRVHGEGVPNPHYLSRRTHTTIIACDCLYPCDDACFCDAVGSLGWRKNADVFLTALDDEILVESFSERGRTLVQRTALPVCDAVDSFKERVDVRRSKPFGRQFSVPLSQIGPIIAGQWSSPVWENHVQRCFSCGSCNLVCPTCYCFNVRDDFELSDGSSGGRTATWDGCMLPTFSIVAGGHDFRPLALARQRHRVKRKFQYLTQRFEEGAFCVGCGRCGRQCTANIDIFDIVNDLIQKVEG